MIIRMRHSLDSLEHYQMIVTSLITQVFLFRNLYILHLRTSILWIVFSQCINNLIIVFSQKQLLTVAWFPLLIISKDKYTSLALVCWKITSKPWNSFDSDISIKRSISTTTHIHFHQPTFYRKTVALIERCKKNQIKHKLRKIPRLITT